MSLNLSGSLYSTSTNPMKRGMIVRTLARSSFTGLRYGLPENSWNKWVSYALQLSGKQMSWSYLLLASIGWPFIKPFFSQSNSTTSQMSTKAHGHCQTRKQQYIILVASHRLQAHNSSNSNTDNHSNLDQSTCQIGQGTLARNKYSVKLVSQCNMRYEPNHFITTWIDK